MVTMRFPIESNDSRSGRLYDQGRGADVYTTKPQEIIGSQFVSNSTIHGDVINNFKPNRLSYITYDPEANRWWMSQADAARDTGHTEDNISKHILHGKPLSDGLELVRKGIAA
jgi:hypothetical protein